MEGLPHGLQRHHCSQHNLTAADAAVALLRPPLAPSPPADNHVQVLQVTWGDRLMAFNTTIATNTSKWLNVYGINRFLTDFDVNHPAELTVTLAGWVSEPCPAQATYGAPGVYCEYAFHGVQSQYTCCPLGFTGQATVADTCGCRDDLSLTPYRMAYSRAAEAGASLDLNAAAASTFDFNLALVDVQFEEDFEGADLDLGRQVWGAAGQQGPKNLG